MSEERNIFDEYLSSQDLKEKSLSYSLSNLRSNIPRVNFKKIKLPKEKDLDNLLRVKNITRVYLDETLFSLEISKKFESRNESFEKSVSRLRKKGAKQEQDKQITFNMEAQVVQEEESVIYSPSSVLMPPYKEDVISSSGEGESLAWPPIEKEEKSFKEDVSSEKPQSKEVKKDIPEQEAKKKKPYFLSLPDDEKKQVKESKSEVKPEKPKEQKQEIKPQGFPWAKPEESYEGLDTLFQGGLESELIGIDKSLPPGENLPQELDLERDVSETSKQEVLHEREELSDIFTVPKEVVQIEKVPVFALKPNIQVEQMSFEESAKSLSRDKEKKRNDSKNDKLKRKAGSMFKLTPMRIVIIGGATATLSYLFCNYGSMFFGGSNVPGTKISIQKVFKQNHVKKEGVDQADKDPSGLHDQFAFQPITEKERLALVEKARQAIESKIDPFGFESFFPKTTEKEKKLAKAKEKGEVPLQRKQVELVGVISTSDKNLALVNVYTVDYTVKIDDDKKARETALKTALAMAVPNRVEVSILDPVEDWYVKMINKSKSRSEDPSIALVKGDQQFKLNVGQKVLLPEERAFEDIVAEIEAKEKETEAALNALGLGIDTETEVEQP